MSRIKINLPDRKPLFQTKIPLRVTDMNYGNHLGNDRILALSHEARVQWLATIGLTELDIGGCGLIMADAAVTYKNEGHQGDVINVTLYRGQLDKRSFELLYDMKKINKSKPQTLAIVKTGMVGFDYQNKKISPLPKSFQKQL